MLVDQYLGNGVDVTFFGRKTKANPTLARLVRQVECPIHGVRIIRLPNHRFRAELSEEVKPVRDASGQIDIQGTMQAVTTWSKAGCANIRTSGCGCTADGGEDAHSQRRLGVLLIIAASSRIWSTAPFFKERACRLTP